MKNLFKRFLSMVIAVMLLCGVAVTSSCAAGDTRKCYTISDGYTTVYQDTSLRTKLGTIYPTDELIVHNVTGSYTQVSYPISASGGYKTGYIPTSAILLATGGSTMYATAQITTYKRPSTASTYGSVSKGDKVMVLGAYGNFTQLKYPVSGGYKYAFVSTSDAQRYLVANLNTSTSSSTAGGTASSGWRYPVSNSYVCGNDWSQYYSPRASVGRPDHVGIDIKSGSGDSAIYAAADGVIEKTGWNDANGYYVIVRHSLGGKTVYSFYAHLSAIKRSSGAVGKGDQIGVIGNTGSGSAGTHLHFAIVDQVWNGSYYGYVPSFTGDKVVYQGVTYYNPHYVVSKGKLP